MPNPRYETFKKGIENENPEICANVMIGLIRLVSYLLYNQIKSLEQSFLKEGGLRERMTKARIELRNKYKKDNLGRWIGNKSHLYLKSLEVKGKQHNLLPANLINTISRVKWMYREPSY